MTFSLIPPPLASLALLPPKGVAPTEWSPIRDHNKKHTPPLPLTALICLDAAHASSLPASPPLSEQPVLVRVPAKTCESGVGAAMQA